MKLHIDPNWNFKQIVINIKKLKDDYNRILSSFSYFQIKEVTQFKREIRDKFYALNIYEWQADKLWDYMNDFCPYTDFIGIINRK